MQEVRLGEAETIDLDFAWTRFRVLCEVPEVAEAIDARFGDRITDAPGPVGLLVRRGEERGSVRTFHRVLDSGAPVLARTLDASEAAAVACLHLAQVARAGEGGTWLRLRALVSDDSAVLVAPGLMAEIGKWARPLAKAGWTMAPTTLTEMDTSLALARVVLLDGERTVRVRAIIGGDASIPVNPALRLRVLTDAALLSDTREVAELFASLVPLVRDPGVELVNPGWPDDALISLLGLPWLARG